MSENPMPLRDILRYPRLYEGIGTQTQEWLITVSACPPLFRDFGVGMAGWTRAREDFCFIRPNPPHGHILACFDGRGEVLINGAWAICEAGTAYLTPPDVRHAYRAIPGEIWRFAWMHDYNGLMAGPPRLVPAHADDFYAVLHGLYREINGDAEIPVMEDWLRLALTQSRRIAGAGRPPGRLRGLWDTVAADPAHDWSIAEMTRWVGVSEERLRRLSLAETGLSPMRQVAALRMRHAEALLSSGRYSIAEVAARVGYENPFAFSTAFKRLSGHPPSKRR